MPDVVEISGIVLGGLVLGLISTLQKPVTIRKFLLGCAVVYLLGVATVRQMDADIAYAPYQHDWYGFPFSTASWLYPAGLKALAGLAIAAVTRFTLLRRPKAPKAPTSP
jgi:hypothetical protein